MKYLILLFLFITTSANAGYTLQQLKDNHVTSYCRHLMIWQTQQDGTSKLVDNPDRTYYISPACGPDDRVTYGR